MEDNTNQPIKLADGEQIIGSWDYAKFKEKAKTYGGATFTVTNKRIINRTETDQGSTRSEMALSNVRTLNGSVKYVRLLPLLVCGIIFLVLGLLFTILSLALEEIEIPIYIGLILLAVGVILFIVWSVYRRKSFLLVITGAPHDAGMTVGRSALATTGKKKPKTRDLKIVIDSTAAAEIVDTVGSAIFANQG